MKTFIIALLAIGVVACNSGEKKPAETTKTTAEGEFAVRFVNGNFSEAQAQAKSAEKMMLVDVFADWCVPCKKLDRAVFKDPESGNFINHHFVSVKIDGEKGEGPEIMDRFNITGYPTILVLDADGNEIDRIVGFGEKQEFLTILNDYINGVNTIAYWQKKADENPEDTQALIVVAEKLWEKSDFAAAVPYYEKLASVTKDDEQLQVTHLRLAEYALTNDDVQPFKKLLAGNTLNEDYRKSANLRMLSYYRKKGDQPNLIQTYDVLIKENPGDISLLNNYAWYIFENQLEDKYPLGIEMAQKAVKINPQADYIWDTLAQLQFATGNVDDAIKSMKEAISLNPQENSYKELLNKYEAQKSAA